MRQPPLASKTARDVRQQPQRCVASHPSQAKCGTTPAPWTGACAFQAYACSIGFAHIVGFDAQVLPVAHPALALCEYVASCKYTLLAGSLNLGLVGGPPAQEAIEPIVKEPTSSSKKSASSFFASVSEDSKKSQSTGNQQQQQQGEQNISMACSKGPGDNSESLFQILYVFLEYRGAKTHTPCSLAVTSWCLCFKDVCIQETGGLQHASLILLSSEHQGREKVLTFVSLDFGVFFSPLQGAAGLLAAGSL